MTKGEYTILPNKISRIIEVDTTKKHIFFLSENITDKEFDYIYKLVSEFFEDDSIKIMIAKDTAITKVETVDND